MKKYRIGYTQGAFDVFHIGHLNLLQNAKKMCDVLVVGVNSDNLINEYKYRSPLNSETDRLAIVSNIKAVDYAFISSTLEKMEAWEKIRFDAVFIGDDWKGSERWLRTEKELSAVGSDVIYLPYTHGISSTMLRLFEDNA